MLSILKFIVSIFGKAFNILDVKLPDTPFSFIEIVLGSILIVALINVVFIGMNTSSGRVSVIGVIKDRANSKRDSKNDSKK